MPVLSKVLVVHVRLHVLYCHPNHDSDHEHQLYNYTSVYTYTYVYCINTFEDTFVDIYLSRKCASDYKNPGSTCAVRKYIVLSYFRTEIL